MEINKTVLKLKDILGKAYYKATFNIPAFSLNKTMVFEDEKSAWDWLGRFTTF